MRRVSMSQKNKCCRSLRSDFGELRIHTCRALSAHFTTTFFGQLLHVIVFQSHNFAQHRVRDHAWDILEVFWSVYQAGMSDAMVFSGIHIRTLVLKSSCKGSHLTCSTLESIPSHGSFILPVHSTGSSEEEICSETQGPTPLVPMQGSTDRAGGTASASGLRLPGESKTHIAPPDATYTRLRP